MKSTFATIVLERHDIYKNICQVFWDLVDEEWSSSDFFEAIRSPELMAKALQQGQTPMIVDAVQMEIVDQLEQSKTPFVVVIMDGTEVWATINGKDVAW